MESYLTPLSLVGPSSIRLLGVRESLSAGAPHEVSCEAAGARPPPEVTWWRGDTRIEAGVSPPQVSRSENIVYWSCQRDFAKFHRALVEVRNTNLDTMLKRS